MNDEVKTFRNQKNHGEKLKGESCRSAEYLKL